MKFTAEQQKVIDARNCNLLVSAAAGSGKTAVLVERIIRLITDSENPVDIDRFLIVTFTRAAAAQMRSKISSAIEDALDKDPTNTILQKQAALVHNAQIVTIDSFCQYVLRNSFADIDLNPGFRIADNNEIKLIEADALEQILEEAYEEAEEDFVYLSECFSSEAEFDSLGDIIQDVYNIAMSNPWPEEWLSEHAHDYDIPEGCNELYGAWYDRVILIVRVLLGEAYLDICEALKCAEYTEGPYMYAGLLESEKEALYYLIRWMDGQEYIDYDEIAGRISGISFGRLPACKDESVSLELKEEATRYRNGAKATLKTVTDLYFARTKKGVISQMHNCDRILCKLMDVTTSYKLKVDELKADKGVLSFSDAEHMALNVLVKKNDDGTYSFTDAARDYRGHYDYVFIDEYQDSNLIQELILAAVSGNEDGINNRFMVGDLKQSIYRFRQADPSIFVDKYNSYDEDSKDNTLINLHRNFRSRKQVLDTTNAIFSRIMSASLGGIDYDRSVALQLGADYPEPDNDRYTTEFHIYDKANSKNLTASEIEARGVAIQIKDLMTNMKVRVSDDSKELRPLKYGDIVILMRSPRDRAPVFKRVLEELRIPVHIAGTEGYFSTNEIRTLLNLLRTIDNPLQDICLYGTMESIIGGFIPEEIAMIRILYTGFLPTGTKTDEGYLYKACQYVADMSDDGNDAEHIRLRDKVRAFLNMIGNYRHMSEYMSVEELITTIIRDTDYRAIVSAMRGGARRLANVDLLIKKAMDYSQTSYFGLYNFLRYVDTIQKYSMDEAEAETIDENADVVRIMSIHKSKGLEFPVCFVSCLGKGWNNKDSSKPVIVDEELGVGIADIDPVRRQYSDNIRRMAVEDYIKIKMLSEEERVLYVAMTRAKEKLIMTAVISDPDKHFASLPKNSQDYQVSASDLVRGHGYVDWLLIPATCLGYRDKLRELPTSLEIPELSYVFRYFNEEALKDSELADEINEELLKEQLEEMKNAGAGKTDIRAYLEAIYDSEYKHPELAGLYTKTSVSVLKHAAMEESEGEHRLFHNTDATSGDSNAGAARGTAFHRLLELIRLSDYVELSREAISERLLQDMEQLVSQKYLTRSEQQIFVNKYNLGLIVNFLCCPLAKRMARAQDEGCLYKEAPFMLGIPANVVDPNLPSEETVLIQGIIDVYWQEDDGYVILDYKTDRVSDASELISRYKVQLDLYARALSQMHKEVKEKVIYSFALEEIINI